MVFGCYWTNELVLEEHRGAPAITWDGASFAGVLVDRTPLLAGGEVIIAPLPFVITSNQVSMSVRASAIGDPDSFMFDPVTIVWSSEQESLSAHFTDDFDPFFNPWP